MTDSTPRSFQHVFTMLEQLPQEALFELAEWMIARLDTIGPGCDLEPEGKACGADGCGGVAVHGDGRCGDAADAKPDEDDVRQKKRAIQLQTTDGKPAQF